MLMMKCCLFVLTHEEREGGWDMEMFLISMWATLMLKFIKLKFVMRNKAREEVFLNEIKLGVRTILDVDSIFPCLQTSSK